MTAVKDETDEADDAENDAAMFFSAADAILAEFLFNDGLDGATGGVTLWPERESAVECGLIIRSETDDAEDESILIVLFELVGENC